MADQTPEWRPVVGYEGLYEVSSTGLVRSVDRVTPHGRRRKAQMIALSRLSGGYSGVELYKNGRGKTKTVSHLVAEAFLGQRPAGYDVCHCDGSRTNDSVANLRYDTKSANQQDRRVHGTHSIGEKSVNARLTWEAARDIRESAEPDSHLAKKYRVSRKAVWFVRKNRTWREDLIGAAQ